MQKIISWHSYLSTQQAPDPEIRSISPIWADNSLATSLFRQILPRSIIRYYPALQADIWYDSERIFAQFNALMQKIGSWHSYLSTQQAPDPEIGSIAAIWADNSLATSLFRQILPRSIGRYLVRQRAHFRTVQCAHAENRFLALLSKHTIDSGSRNRFHLCYLGRQQSAYLAIYADSTPLYRQYIWYDSECIFAQFNVLMQKIGSWHSYLSTQQALDPVIGSISPFLADNSLATSLFRQILPRSIGKYYPALQADIWYDTERIFAQFNALMQKIGSWHSNLSTQYALDQVIGSIAAIWADNSWADISLATSLFMQILPSSIGMYYPALQADIWYDSERIFAQFNALMQKIISWHSYLSTQQAPDPEIRSISPIWADNSLATSLFRQILPRSIGRYYPALQAVYLVRQRVHFRTVQCAYAKNRFLALLSKHTIGSGSRNRFHLRYLGR